MRLPSALLAALGLTASRAAAVEIGDAAPTFSAPSTSGPFDLASRRGKGWTVIYFFPKALTPG